MSENRHLYKINQITEYEKENELTISKQKRKKIQYQLQIQKEAYFSANERTKKNDNFLKFNSNPFSSIKHKKHAFSKFGSTKASTPRSILTQFSNIQEKKVPEKKLFNEHNTKVNDQRRKAQYLSAKSINTGKPSKAFMKKPAITVVQNEQKKKKINIGISDMLKISDYDYFTRPDRKIKIFENIQSPKQLLDQYHFCFSSTVQKIQNIKIPIKRDISRLARSIMINDEIKEEDLTGELDSVQLSFKPDNLLLVDILNIASGRLSAQFITKTMKDTIRRGIQKSQDGSSEEAEQQEIIYHEKAKNERVLNNLEELRETYQIQQFKVIDNLPQENFHEIKYMKKNKYIRDLLKERQNFYNLTINDQNQHRQNNKKIKEQFQGFSEMDVNQIELDRLIRINKMSKSKNQNIKLRYMLEAFMMQNKDQQKIQKIYSHH